ncbi:MAG: PAS domain S-box protein [Methanoregula sp.]|jgi:PAS domain S-box-containing protein|nr:PAS domain S-box protein [Methanoregula sp.]
MNDNRKIPAENAKNGQVSGDPGVKRALSEGEEKFHEIFDKVNDAIHIHEILIDGSPGTFIEVNEVACRMLQYSKEELLCHTPLDLTTDYHSRPLSEIITELATRGNALFETEHTRKDGVIIPVEVNAHVIQYDKKKRVLSVVRDITERKLAEKALRESESKYKQLVTMLNEGIWMIDQNATTTFVNRKMAEILGYTVEDMMGKPAYFFTSPELSDAIKLDINASEAEEPKQREVVLLKNDGSTVYTLMNTTGIRDESGKYLGGIAGVIDITERKIAEEALQKSETKYKQLVTMLNEGILVIDRNATITFANNKLALMLGFALDEIVGKPVFSFLPPDLRDKAKVGIESERSGEVTQREVVLIRKDGSQLSGLMVTTPVLDARGMSIGGIAAVIDITERTQMERVVLASLKEKEILLKEIHHRVKNNLQIIASLLSLQSRYVTDENVLNVLKESQNRVKAMALVHERLYRSENLSEVALSDYLRFLIDNLFGFYGANPQEVRMSFDAGDVKVDINKAIPIGLIINELVSNSFKHAFPEGKKGDLTITLRQDERSLVMTVHDTGPGIPADFDWRNAKSLGLRLVISLVEQISGTIELDRSGGTTFKISIPKTPGQGGNHDAGS